jgi:hypothetical protein
MKTKLYTFVPPALYLRTVLLTVTSAAVWGTAALHAGLTPSVAGNASSSDIFSSAAFTMQSDEIAIASLPGFGIQTFVSSSAEELIPAATFRVTEPYTPSGTRFNARRSQRLFTGLSTGSEPERRNSRIGVIAGSGNTSTSATPGNTIPLPPGASADALQSSSIPEPSTLFFGLMLFGICANGARTCRGRSVIAR